MNVSKIRIAIVLSEDLKQQYKSGMLCVVKSFSTIEPMPALICLCGEQFSIMC